MAGTKIEWCTKVWNPFTGCSWASSGCDHCYAKPFALRMKLNPNAKVAYKYRNGFEPTFHPESLSEPATWKKPQRIFVCSMSDLFHEKHSFDDICEVMNTIRRNHMHTFLVLTKRPERMKAYFNWVNSPPFGQIDYSTNLWLGVTIENQEQADNRIPVLLTIPAVKRFISVEPMLGDVNLRKRITQRISNDMLNSFELISCIDWVIAGGETGSKARPLNPKWIYSIRNQCNVSGVPFFFKQWGEYGYGEWSDKNDIEFLKIGKSKAGRLIDGVEWNMIPGVI